MKWTYSIKNKFSASAVLLALCLLVLLSNYLDRIHTQNVKHSISTLYEDRLIAEDYILKMTSNIYQIREVLNAESNIVAKSNIIRKLIDTINNTYFAYSKTRLTVVEKVTAMELASCIKKFDQTFLKNNFSPSEYTAQALISLNKLSVIQLEESKLIMKNVESQYANIKASSQFAFAIIIIILLLLQIMIFSADSLIPVYKPRDPSLN